MTWCHNPVVDQLKGRNSVLFIVVIVLAGGIWYFLNGGPSGTDGEESAVKKPHNAFEMTVSSVQEDGSFRGKVEPSGRHAQAGLERIGSYDRVTLRLADVEPQRPVQDPCWIDEGQAAIKDLIGARIWVDPKSVEEDGRGRFLVHAWNRSDAFVQEELLRDGDARLFGGRVAVAYRDALEAAEDEAAAEERGLWGACGGE